MYSCLLSPLEWILISFNWAKWNSIFSAFKFMIFKIFLLWTDCQRPLTGCFSIHTPRLVISIVTYCKTATIYSCCSVAKAWPTLCDPMNHSLLGFPVLHHLPEFVQTYAHWVSDTIQPSHSLLRTVKFLFYFTWDLISLYHPKSNWPQ